MSFVNSVLPEVTVPLSVELDIPIVCLVAAVCKQFSVEKALDCLLIKHLFLISSKAKIYFLHVALEYLLLPSPVCFKVTWCSL